MFNTQEEKVDYYKELTDECRRYQIKWLCGVNKISGVDLLGQMVQQGMPYSNLLRMYSAVSLPYDEYSINFDEFE
jgi:hypothetical protein